MTFLGDEILAMAEQIERNGAAFYRKAAQRAQDANRETLQALANMEDDHEKTFAQMRKELPPEQTVPVSSDPNNPVALYLQAVVDGRIFRGNPAEQLTGEERLQQIYHTAIDLEKDLIVFYQSIKEGMTDSRAKETISSVIRQEIGHLLTLTKELETLDI